MPWHQRPKASALLEAANSSERPFNAIVVGEYERAFVGDQFKHVVTELGQRGVKVWLPEAGGPVDLDDSTHHALMTVLGAQSQREVLRSRYRVLAAMRAQTCEQGRYLGGRPPYGYRLVDAGPHPNHTHVAWGRRLQRLDSDPVTAPHVRWIFAERLAGRSIAGIARRLNTGCGQPFGRRPTAQPAPVGTGVDSTDRGRDPEQPPLHRSRGLATDLRCSLCPHRWPGQRLPGRARAGVGGLEKYRASGAGQREGLRRGPSGTGEPPDQGRTGSRVSVHRVAGVPNLRSADGRTLGQRSARVSVPPRLQQFPAARIGSDEESLCPGGPGDGRARGMVLRQRSARHPPAFTQGRSRGPVRPRGVGARPARIRRRPDPE